MKTQLRPRARTGNQVVHFELKDLPAAKVCIAGTFNDWSHEATEMIPLGGGWWVKDLILPPGTYEYRLIVDGRWMTDPACPHTVPNPLAEPIVCWLSRWSKRLPGNAAGETSVSYETVN